MWGGRIDYRFQAQLDLLANGLGIETRWFEIDNTATLTQDPNTDAWKKHPVLSPKTKP
jgi:hypothetical protein